MSAIMKYNKGKVFDVDLKGAKELSLAEIHSNNMGALRVDAIMFSEKGKYGKSVFIVTGHNIVWLPKHMVKRCEEILADAECIEDIKSGSVAFEVETYTDETGATRFSIKWCDNN